MHACIFMHFCNALNELMVMKEDLDFKEITNARISSRMKQVIILVIIIIAGIVITTMYQPS